MMIRKLANGGLYLVQKQRKESYKSTFLMGKNINIGQLRSNNPFFFGKRVRFRLEIVPDSESPYDEKGARRVPSVERKLLKLKNKTKPETLLQKWNRYEKARGTR